MLYRLAPADRFAWLGLAGPDANAPVVEADDLADNDLLPIPTVTRRSVRQGIRHACLPTKMTREQEMEVRHTRL